jgi:uncharacterized cupin superfamily protein
MADIKVEGNLSEDRLTELGVKNWKIQTLRAPPPPRYAPRRRILDGSASEFPWDSPVVQVWYIREGQATVTPVNGAPVEIKSGDLVTLPKNTVCVWRIRQTLKMHCGFPGDE